MDKVRLLVDYVQLFYVQTVQTVAIVAEEQLASTFQCSLASGVAFNKAELELDYTTNAPATINFDATAYYVVDRDADASRSTARNFMTGDSLFIQSDFSSLQYLQNLQVTLYFQQM